MRKKVVVTRVQAGLFLSWQDRRLRLSPTGSSPSLSVSHVESYSHTQSSSIAVMVVVVTTAEIVCCRAWNFEVTMAFSGYVRTALTSRPSSDSGTVGGCSTTAAAAAFTHLPEVEHTDVLMTLHKRAALTLIFILP